MAARCSTAVVGSVGPSCRALLSNGRPQASPSLLFCYSYRVSQRTPFGSLSLGDHLVLPREARALRRKRSWRQAKLQLQLRKVSSSFSLCLATNVSSDPATAEINVVEATGSGSGMSIEEKNAIMSFEGLSTDGTEVEEEEVGNSMESLETTSAEEERNPEATDKSTDAAKVQRRSPPKAVKGKGSGIASVMTLFIGLLDRPFTGDGRMIGGAGSAVLERVEEEVDKLRAVEGVDGQYLFEILRIVKLLQMDLQLLAAARKDSTLLERLEQTKARCRQVLDILAFL